MTEVTFPAGYNRVGVIEILAGDCDSCGAREKVLYIDSSEGEYGPGRICRTCANALFEGTLRPKLHAAVGPMGWHRAPVAEDD
jgi:hypothetical protein